MRWSGAMLQALEGLLPKDVTAERLLGGIFFQPLFHLFEQQMGKTEELFTEDLPEFTFFLPEQSLLNHLREKVISCL